MTATSTGWWRPGSSRRPSPPRICRRKPAKYEGSSPTTKLKVVGTDVFSMGDVEQLDQRDDVRTIVWSDKPKGLYRRLVLRRNRLVGALAVGAWPELSRLQQAVRDADHVAPWHCLALRAHRPSLPRGAGQIRDRMACGRNGLQLHRRHARPIGFGHLRRRRHDRASDARDQRQHGLRLLPPAAARIARRESGARAGLRLRAALRPSRYSRCVALAAAIGLPAWPYSPKRRSRHRHRRPLARRHWSSRSPASRCSGCPRLSRFSRSASASAGAGSATYNFWRVAHVVIGTAALAALFFAHRLQSRQQSQSLADGDIPRRRRSRQRDRRS